MGEPVEEEPLPKPVLTTAVKRRNFLVGLLGWYCVNGLLWFALSGGGFDATDATNSNAICFLLPANILLPIVLGIIKPTRWFALGMLSAIALNFVVALVLGVFVNALCFVPFFFNTGF